METHKQYLSELREIMRYGYFSLNRKANPVSVHLAGTTQDQLMHILGQYTLFPKNIVSFLRKAQGVAGTNKWQLVYEELERNIGEEQGSQTEGVPHYDILVKGISDELEPDFGYAPGMDLENKLRSLEASPAMYKFINRMPEIVGNKDPAYAIGGTYALEISAVPELVIVREALEKVINEVTGSLMARDGYLGKFFGAHLRVWEPGHEEGLRKTSETYITTPETRKKFEEGFRDTMKAMDPMWTGLYQESKNI